ncbi:MAG: hypothetical protein JKY70_02315 [Mucilaginibacter sp.]|nr:hypothetical protein [Mucilaginibacter sp.]
MELKIRFHARFAIKFPKLNFKDWALVVDGLSRFLIGYVLCQFIQAFRKHSKRA